MKLRLLLLFLLFASVFVELNIVSFPLIFLFTYVIFSLNSQFKYLLPAAILSLAGDSVMNHSFGITIIIVLFSVLGVMFYSRFLGSKDTLVYIMFGVIGVFVYAIILGYSITSLFNWLIISIVIWIIFRLVPKKYLSL